MTDAKHSAISTAYRAFRSVRAGHSAMCLCGKLLPIYDERRDGSEIPANRVAPSYGAYVCYECKDD